MISIFLDPSHMAYLAVNGPIPPAYQALHAFFLLPPKRPMINPYVTIQKSLFDLENYLE